MTKNNFSKYLSGSIFMLLLLLLVPHVRAGTPTPATGGGAISAGTAATGGTGAWTSLTGPIYTETLVGDLSTGTVVLTVPTGFAFNTGSTVKVVLLQGENVANKNINNTAVNGTVATATVTASTITFTITSKSNGQNLNKIQWQGIQVRPLNGYPLASGNITASGGAFSTTPPSSTNFGTLTEVAGAVTKLLTVLAGQAFAAGTGVTGTPSNQTAGVSFNISAIIAADAYFNIVTTYAGTKTLSYSGPTGVTTYTTSVVFASGQSTTTLATTISDAQTTTISVSDGTTSGPASSSFVVGATVGSFNAFETNTVANAATGKMFTKLSGVAFSFDIVALTSAATPAVSSGFTGTVKVELVDNSGGGACGTLSSLTPAISNSETFTSANLGRHTVSAVNVARAWRNIKVRISYPAVSPTITSCSTDNLSVRPATFAISSTDATNAGSSSTPVIKTGANFSLIAASSIVGYDGTPSVDNTSGMVIGTPNAGAIGGSFGSASAATGTATGASFFYNEVGNFGLSSNAVYDSSFTSVDTSGVDCTADFSNTLVNGKYGCSIGSTAIAQTTNTSGFGRFIPDNFDISYNTPSIAVACGTFTYVGRTFNYSTSPVMIVTARSGTNNGLSDSTTKNYAGSYVKMTTASLTPVTQASRYSRFDALAPPANNTPALDTSTLPDIAADPVIGTFANGVGTLTFSSGAGIKFVRSTTAVNAPFNADIALTLNVIDTDAVAYGSNPAHFGTATAGSGIAFDGGNNAMRFGRLWLGNAYGTEKRNLALAYETQYWNGQVFTKNTDDSCTALTAANFGIGNYQPAAFTSANLPVTAISVSAISAGGGKVTFAAPNAAGSVDVVAKLDSALSMCPISWTPAYPSGTPLVASYLQGKWCGAGYAKDPAVRTTFGIFGSSLKKGPIYVRESY